MTAKTWTLFFSFAWVGFWFALAGSQPVQADSHSDPESFMKHYLHKFDTGHVWEITPLYNDPFYMLAPSGGIKVFEGKKKIRKSIKDWKFYMRKAGVETSRYVQLNIRELSSDTALASAEVERMDEHGTVRANTGATYTLIRVDGQWKIYLIHLHPRERVFDFQ
jgi:hypothetical protein